MIKKEKILRKHLDDHGLDIFSLEELRKAAVLPERQLKLALQNLIRSDYIDTIERGKYCRHNFRDHFVIACNIVSDGIISYWNAMNYHGLTEQIPNVIFVKTNQRKKNKSIFGIRYIFCRKATPISKGYETGGYGNHTFRISDIEQTIVDAFDKPGYSGEYAEIIKAFYKADINAKKLITYCKLEDNISLTKRLAFLAELLKKPKMNAFIKYAEKEVTEKYSLFEIGGETKGKTNRRWRLILNIPIEEIKEMALSW